MNPDNQNDLVVFNPDYLSALVTYPDPLEPPTYLYFDQLQQVCETRDPFASSWLYQTLHWYLGLDRQRISLILNGDTDILLKHDWSAGQLEKLRQSPLAIYMYEPLFIRDQRGLYPYIPGTAEGRPNARELEWVQDFIEKINHPGPVTVYTCDYNVSIEKFDSKRRYTFKLETFDIFLLWASCRLIFDNLTCWRVNKWRREFYPFPRLKKKAVCLNFRWEAFRELIVTHLRSRADFSDLHVSYYHYHRRPKFLENLGFDPFQWTVGPTLEKASQTMQGELPYVCEVQEPTRALDPLESPIPDFDGVTNQRKLGNDYYLYTESFLSIVTESRCITPFACVSEKTLKPMLMKRPFVLIAGPYALKHLRELGFKTFSDFWDESYDLIERPEKRIQAALKTIDHILDRPLDELKKMLVQMDDILHHNHVHASFGLPMYYQQQLQRQTQIDQAKPPTSSGLRHRLQQWIAR